MENFNQKSITAEVRALVHEVVDRLLDYNPTETTRETTGDKPTFWMELNGYSARMQVSAVKDGFPSDSNPLKDVKRYETQLCEDDSNTNKGIEENLGDILKRMDEIYAQWNKQEENEYENKQN